MIAHRDGGDTYMQIHDVYYDDDGRPDGYGQNASAVGGEHLGEIRQTLERMTECLDKPILSAEDFPREWACEEGEEGDL